MKNERKPITGTMKRYFFVAILAELYAASEINEDRLGFLIDEMDAILTI